MHRICKWICSIMMGVICLPIVLLFAFLIFLYDRKNPLYVAPRVGKNGKLFNMIKLRSMVTDTHKYKMDSTANDDPRITSIGKWVRRFKVDELAQIINVLKGDMNWVGPRPQVPIEVNRYTDVEKGILAVKPGITDLASIVFSDEGKILEGATNPDLLYAQIERPWKSRLALLYIQHTSLWLDIRLIFFTFTNSFARSWTLKHLSAIVKMWPSDVPNLYQVVLRKRPLQPYPIPGYNDVIVDL
ncbi:MAG: sugar transferase [Puniceicoccales bacterium]|nr:sugar transferase [Puniceicoccales bacterium]